METIKKCSIPKCGGEVVSYLRKDLSRYDHRCLVCGSKRIPIEIDAEIIDQNIKLKKQTQRAMDRNRVQNKSFRDTARIHNAFTAFTEQIALILPTIGKKMKSPPKNDTYPRVKDCSEVGFIQISDPHFNELINSKHNKYDMEIASARLYELASQSIKTFKSRGIKSVMIAFTGDMLNSDRRLDEILMQSTNRAKATVVSTELVSKFIADIAGNFEKVSVVSVLGNEGRADKELTYSDTGLSNNYDFTILAMAKKITEASPCCNNVSWGSIDTVELVVDINGQNVLLTHDMQKATSNQRSAQSTIGRYALEGIVISCIFSGHLHATLIADFTYRSASLAGSNSFNEKALNLHSMASQNIAVFGKGYRFVTPIGLQHVNKSSPMYDISSDLMEYNSKSAAKGVNNTVVFKVVI